MGTRRGKEEKPDIRMEISIDTTDDVENAKMSKFSLYLGIVSLLASVAVIIKGLFTPSSFLWLLITVPAFIVAVLFGDDDDKGAHKPPVYPFPGMFD